MVRVVVFVVAILVATLIAQFLHALLTSAHESVRLRVANRITREFLRLMAFVFGVWVHTHGRPPRRTSLIIANHHSYLDGIAVCWSNTTSLVGKASISRWPLIGPAVRATGMVFVERGNRKSGDSAADAIVTRLEKGLSVTNFPEGTTTDGDEPGPFHPGLFRRIAGKAFIITPIRIRYRDRKAHWVGDASLFDHLPATAMRPLTHVDVTFCEPVDALAVADPDVLRALCWQRIARAVPNDATAGESTPQDLGSGWPTEPPPRHPTG